MNTAEKVDQQVAEWKRQGLAKWEIVTATAQACLGWSYVFGGRGQLCTPKNREAKARSEYPEIVKKCQVLDGKKTDCTGCRWYPKGETRFFDCRGFTYWVLKQVGISIGGAGATSQWNDESNWESKGQIANLPKDRVCCLFRRDGNKMQHTGLWLRNGMIIHCSGEVKTGKLSSFTHWAVPKGLYARGETPTESRPTIRKGDKGETVKVCQELLEHLGYDLGKYGTDGDFGKDTEKAVKLFQKNQGLTADGIVGPATWAALETAIRAEDQEAQDPPGSYTVTISGLAKEAAEELLKTWGGAATMKKE